MLDYSKRLSRLRGYFLDYFGSAWMDYCMFANAIIIKWEEQFKNSNSPKPQIIPSSTTATAKYGREWIPRRKQWSNTKS